MVIIFHIFNRVGFFRNKKMFEIAEIYLVLFWHIRCVPDLGRL